MESWDLQAVVDGWCSNDQFGFTGYDDDNNPILLSSSCSNVHHHDQQDELFSFSDVFESNSTFFMGDELEQLYKPFYPSTTTTTTAAASTTTTTACVVQEEVKEELQEERGKESMEKVHKKKADESCSRPVIAPPSKYRRRKNQQKRVVLQVTAKDVSSDMWAWRKYGQKPIKGSPYPRSYYRCSSSKGCLARKQVEQSCTDPGTFIITYSAEHSHSQPTRRNSLAGTNRQKFNSAKKVTSIGPDNSSMKTAKDPTTNSPISTSVLSPTTPLSSIEEEPLHHQQPPIKQESRNEDETFAPDLMSIDDFFVGLEGLGELNSDPAFYGCSSSTKQFPVAFCS